MHFVTNRAFAEGPDTELGRKVTFDLTNNNALQSVFFCDAQPGGTITEIGSKAFLDALRDHPAEQILFFLHGYSNLPVEHVLPRARSIQSLCQKEKLNVLVVPVIWPCDNDLGMIQDYYDDQVAADASGTAFSRALAKFLAWSGANEDNNDPCMKRINILAHSMGNRVLRQTLYEWAKSMSDRIPFVFRNIFMVAADVVNETLHTDQDGSFICQGARNVVVYYASDDLALRSSKIANLKNHIASRRLGHTGPEDMNKTPTNVYAIDCDDVNTLYDNPKGHSYFQEGTTKGQPGAVFRHIAECLRTGRVPGDGPRSRQLTVTDSWPL